jgi:hypothetical protein
MFFLAKQKAPAFAKALQQEKLTGEMNRRLT